MNISDLIITRQVVYVFDLCTLLLQSLMVQKEVVEDLQERLDTAEKALANKQEKIDEMKQEIFEKEKELENVSLFQAQVCTLELFLT